MRHLQDFGHECDRFIAEGLECPFRRFREDADPEEEEKEAEQQKAFEFPDSIPFMVPERRRTSGDVEKNLGAISDLAVAPRELREALERMAAFKQIGELSSIPDFPFSGRGHPAIMSVLAAITIMTVLRSLRSAGFGTGFQGVRTSERHAAKGLAQVGRPVGPGRTMGRGGFQVNAAADLRRLLFGRKKIDEQGGVSAPPGGGPK